MGLQTSLLQRYPNHHLGRTPRGSLAAGRALERGGRRQAGGSLCPGGCRDCWGCTCAPFLPCHAQAPSSELARTRRPGLPPPLATLWAAAVREAQPYQRRCQTRHQGALRTLRLRHALGARSPPIPAHPALRPLQG